MSWNIWLISLAAVFVMMNFVFLAAMKFRKNDLADVAWGPGFIVAGIAAWMARPLPISLEENPRFVLAFVLISLWALRLAVSVGKRNLSTLKEDGRYAKWRKEWGHTWRWRTYLQVFTLQSLILAVIALPIIFLAASEPFELEIFALIGCLVWVIGFGFEAIADFQLNQFKKKPESKGQLMTTGLWSWSRHPNYFGEVMQWWGLFLICLPLPMGWITVLSPLAISFLILRVSGVSMLEEHMKGRAGFSQYAQRTSKFFPWPPKSLN